MLLDIIPSKFLYPSILIHYFGLDVAIQNRRLDFPISRNTVSVMFDVHVLGPSY